MAGLGTFLGENSQPKVRRLVDPKQTVVLFVVPLNLIFLSPSHSMFCSTLQRAKQRSVENDVGQRIHDLSYNNTIKQFHDKLPVNTAGRNIATPNKYMHFLKYKSHLLLSVDIIRYCHHYLYTWCVLLNWINSKENGSQDPSQPQLLYKVRAHH